MEFGGSFVVVVFYVPTDLQYSTVQFCCTCAVNTNTRRTTGTRRDTHHGHYEGTHQQASQGRALRCYCKDTNLLLRSKHIAPKPRIARAPELVHEGMHTAIVLRCTLDQKSIPQYVVVDDCNALPPLFTRTNTGVIQEPSERKKVVKSEVMKVNYCEPKSGDNCRNRKVHLSEVIFQHFSSLLHHFFCV